MNRHFIQFVKFGLVGVLNTLVSLAIIYLLMNLLHLDYRLSNILGYIGGLINSFIWNRNWTFKSRGSLPGEMAKFILAFGICYLAQFGMLLLLVERMGVNPNYAQPAAMVVYTMLNFLLNKLVTFRGARP